jgi:hypothetical protein
MGKRVLFEFMEKGAPQYFGCFFQTDEYLTLISFEKKKFVKCLGIR